VGAHGPRGHTPPRRRDGAEALGRKRPAKISASAARLAHGVRAHGPQGHTPQRRRDGAEAIARHWPATIAASAARLTHGVRAHGLRRHTLPRRCDAAEALGRHWPTTVSASAARLTRTVCAHGHRGHTPPRRCDGAEARGRKRPAKMPTPLRPPKSRCARTVPSRSHTTKHAGRATGTWAQTAGKDVHPPAPAQVAVCTHSAIEVTHHQARGTSHGHLGANGRQRWQPPPPVSLTLWVRMAFEVTHNQGGVTGLGHLGAAGRQRCQPPCARLTRAVGGHGPRGHTPSRRHDGAGALGRSRPAKMAASAACLARAVGANGPRGHTPCPQSARRLNFNGIHPVPAPVPAPHATATHLPQSTIGASDGIDPAGGSTIAARADGDVTHATIARAGACSWATATPRRGRRERRCGAAGGGDAVGSGMR
jgi:hypothetical protein